MLPRRVQKASRKALRWKSPAHRDWVRSHRCCACDGTENLQFAHNRKGTDCGMGQKPDDWYGIVLCAKCHARQHQIGEDAFDAAMGIDRHALAAEFAAASPKRAEIALAQRSRALAFAGDE